ncbi:MAG: hypothetical protein VCB42_05615 [Myxococcota bacterium]
MPTHPIDQIDSRVLDGGREVTVTYRGSALAVTCGEPPSAGGDRAYYEVRRAEGLVAQFVTVAGEPLVAWVDACGERGHEAAPAAARQTRDAAWLEYDSRGPWRADVLREIGIDVYDAQFSP